MEAAQSIKDNVTIKNPPSFSEKITLKEGQVVKKEKEYEGGKIVFVKKTDTVILEKENQTLINALRNQYNKKEVSEKVANALLKSREASFLEFKKQADNELVEQKKEIKKLLFKTYIIYTILVVISVLFMKQLITKLFKL